MKTELSEEWKRRLVRDYKLPVAVLREPYFSHFLELSEDLYRGKTYHDLLLEEVNYHGTEDAFALHRDSVVRKLVSDMMETEAWQDFKNNDTTKLLETGKEWQRDTLYQKDYAGFRYLSLDLKKANFQVLKFLNRDFVLGAESFDELLSRYTNSKYLLSNKAFRQYLFGVGSLYPKRQARVQKHLMFRLYKELELAGLDMSLVMSASNDELVVRLSDNEVKHKVEKTLRTVSSYMELTLEEFTLTQVHPVKPLFSKDFDDGKRVLKRVDAPLVPEVLRYLKGEGQNEMDRYFTHDSRLSMFLDPLYG